MLTDDALDQIDTLYFVTVPRSAYHLLAKRMNFYFGERLEKFESARYRSKEMGEAVRQGCRLVGCHDYGLMRRWPLRRFMEFPKDPSRKHVILFRNPFLGLISHFRLREKNEWKRKGSESDWIRHAHETLDFTKRFLRKWAMDDSFSSTLLLSYEQIAETPEESLKSALEYMAKDDDSADPKLVEKCIERFPFDCAASLDDFEFYDRTFFEELRDRLGDVGDFLESRTEFRIRFEIP